MDGINATRHVVSRLPDTAVLVLSAYGAESLVIESLMAGARGYLLEGRRATVLAEPIVGARGGHAPISWPLTRLVLERLVDVVAENGAAGITVDSREVELEPSIAGVVGDLEHLGADRVKSTAPPGLVAWTDPDRLAQVLTNLIRNALQYAPDSPVEVIANAA